MKIAQALWEWQLPRVPPIHVAFKLQMWQITLLEILFRSFLFICFHSFLCVHLTSIFIFIIVVKAHS